MGVRSIYQEAQPFENSGEAFQGRFLGAFLRLGT